MPSHDCITACPIKRTIVMFALWATAIAGSSLHAQTNPVPFINNPPIPDAAAPGSPGLTLTVNGTGFVSDAIVNWNGSPRATVFVSISQLKATIFASDLSSAGTVSVTVTNPAPGGGTSNAVFFQVTSPRTSAAFANSSTYSSPYAEVVAAADLNGDGILDLVVGSSDASAIVVLLGNGDGTFQSPQTFPTGTAFPSLIALGDLNNDGKLDVVAATFDYASGVAYLSSLLGKGDGTFQPFQSFPLDLTPGWITVGDFNGDGKLDVAVPICPLGTLPFCGAASAVSILLGNGDGTFQPAVNYPAGPSVMMSVAGDFNGDGHLDLAVSGDSDGSFTNGIGILLGKGDGSFQSPSFISGPYYFLTTADLNQDGILDLAAIGNDTISILTGNGDGTFKPPVSYTAGHYLVSIVTGDFNGDGHIDLAVLDCEEVFPASNTIYVLLGKGDGTFAPPAEIATPVIPGSQLGYLASGDFNGDGRLDLTSVQSNGDGGIDNVIATYLQTSISLSPPALAFSRTLVGTDSAPLSVTVNNIGATALGITDVSLTGANAADFTLAAGDCQGATVAAFGSCQISVSFLPTAAGQRNASVSITDNTIASPQQVFLSGRGTFVKLVPSALNFGSVKAGSISAPQTITVINTSVSAVGINGIVVTGAEAGDFQESNTCGRVLAAAASCSIIVRFVPTVTGARAATLDVSVSHGDGPRQAELAGTGVSAGPPTVVTLSPSSGTGLAQTFAAVYSDPNGVADLSAVLVLFNTSEQLASACAVIYVPGTNKMYLYNDSGSALSTAVIPGSSALVSNSQCTLAGTGSSFIILGDNLTLNVALTFSGTFLGRQDGFLDAIGKTAKSGLVKKGSWTP
jgi:hypothetical protein